MVDHWATRAAALNRLENYFYDRANTKQGAIQGHMTWMNIYAASENWGSAFNSCYDALNAINWAIGYLVGSLAGEIRDYAIPLYLDKFTIAEAADPEEYELTVGKIMAAMIDSTTSERLMYVLTVDELRRFSWNERFETFRMAGPKGE